MLDYFKLFNKYGRPKGIVHIGSQFLFSRINYLSLNFTNTVWIEVNPFFYDYALPQLMNTDEKIFNVVIGDKTMSISYSVNNETKIKEIPAISLINLMNENNIDSNFYDFLHIGIQNSGTINFDGLDLEKFKYLSIETNKDFDKSLTGDTKNVDKYLKQFRLKKVDEVTYGNIAQVFYVKKRKYNKK
jgi:hypothetical protein